ncbi:protein ALP1-like isoform X2 [Pieris napi]|nr:protein ALP1-like isoform X2 [Pieris napi]
MLSVTLRYMASGNSFTDLFYTYKMGIATISNIVDTVCCAIWEKFGKYELTVPTNEKWKTIAEDFEGRAHFPHCLGAVDGKHIRIENFPNSGSMNLNYKGYFSIVLMAVVDSNYKFIFVDIGSYGKDCDSAIFQRTQFYKLLSEGRLQIPPPSLLHPNQSVRTPYVLVGDEAFQLTHNILRPYSGNQLTIQQRVFNYRLIRARRYVECAFGILANKWRIFHRPLNVSKKLGKNIVKACVVLHNLVRDRDGYRSADGYVATETAFVDLPDSNVVQGGRTANDIRNNFAEYFTSPEGSLPWQMSKI